MLPFLYPVETISPNWAGPSRSLQEYLTAIPGVFTLNSSNYAQDLRISIRGFGARAGFGIRGIKLVVDGIPETTPDGQGQLDNLPFKSYSRNLCHSRAQCTQIWERFRWSRSL